jgi:hypothetical protein
MRHYFLGNPRKCCFSEGFDKGAYHLTFKSRDNGNYDDEMKFGNFSKWVREVLIPVFTKLPNSERQCPASVLPYK